MVLMPRTMVVALTFALVTNVVAQCAGWSASPEARMACCVEGVACPMHKPHGAGSSGRTMSQADADACCANAEASQSSSSQPSVNPASSPLLLLSAVALDSIPPVALEYERWRTPIPSRVSPTPRYVLLSVFLI
jgi:hypothetical protein